jgi:branched-chain amino acid aminotransferase
MKSDPTKWGVSSVQLQCPEHIFFDGRVRPWEEAVFHVSTEAVVRGLNVLKWLKGHWQEDGGGRFAWRTLRRHYERMRRSARLLQITVEFDYDEFVDACLAITRADKDLYVRAKLFVVEGRYGEGTVPDLVVTAYKQEREPTQPIDVRNIDPHPSVELTVLSA